MNKSFDETCIDDKELKIELEILQLIEKQNGMVVALLAVSNYFDPQVPSLIQLHKDDQQRNNLPKFIYLVSYKLLLTVFVFCSNLQVYKTTYSFLLRVYLRMPQSVTRMQLSLRRSRVNLAKFNN